MKKTLLLVVVGVLMGSTLSFAATKLFFDVPSDAWYRGSAMRLADREIMNGYGDGSFQGSKNVSRAEVAALLDRLLQYSEDTRNANLSFIEAQQIAGSSSVCSNEGVVGTKGSYNHFTKTWWFDIKATKCNPACVVDDTTRGAEINWRCA